VVLLGLLSVYVIVSGVTLFLILNDNLVRELIKQDYELDQARKSLDKAKENGSLSEIADAKKGYDKALGEGTRGCFDGCFKLFFGVLGGLVQIFAEVTLIIAALAMHVGLPIIGYLAFASWFASLMYDLFLSSKIAAKQKERDEALGNTYIPKKNPVRRFLQVIPIGYALYILLIVIGIL